MKRRGFTLIELVIVLAVIVVASGVLIFRVTGWSSRQKLESSARTLGNTIRTWREKARSDEQTYVLRIEPGSYTIIVPPEEVLRRGKLGAGEEFERGAPASIAFTPRGVLPETRLTIRNSRGERIQVILRALINEVDYADAP
jgi:prepilin-type N-terminal cleavage/methylation domain-containing protein